MDELLARTFLDHTLRTWLISLAVALATAALLYVVTRVVVGRMSDRARRSKFLWDDAAVTVLASTGTWFMIAMGLWAATAPLSLSPDVDTVVVGIGVSLLLLQCALWLHRLVSLTADAYRRRHVEADPGSVTTTGVFAFLAKLVVWSVVLLLALDNIGIDVTALVAGLGVGGIAVALAVQNILGDLFASLSIVLDKPFVVGDFLIVGDQLGTVERIGIKTTRLRALGGEQIIISNGDLLGSRVHNYKRMEERRVVTRIGVTYQTPADKLRLVPDVMREAVERLDDTRFDRAHLAGFGASSIDFELVHYVLSSDYALYMDRQQDIALFVVERFEDEEIEFAYPTQTLFVRHETQLDVERVGNGTERHAPSAPMA